MKINKSRLDALLARKDMSVRQLAEESGVSIMTINKARSGANISNSKAMDIADALGVDPEVIELVEMPEEEPEPLPEGITATLEAIQKYAEEQRQKAKEEAFEIFKEAVLEAIARWEDLHDGQD